MEPIAFHLGLHGCRASIHTPYAIRACMEYGVWLKPRMELYGIYIPYINTIYHYIVSLLDVAVPSCPEMLPTKNCSTTSTGRPSVMPLRIQLFRHSPVLIVSAPRDIRSHEIVRCALEKTRSGSADIAGIKRISIAIFDKHGYCSCCSSRSH